MPLLYDVIIASACANTHHRLAMDALRHLRGPDAELWRNLFLKHYERYLAGSKAPDNEFKDFKNHVLHVDDNFWGGAVAATKKWYDQMVSALHEKSWPDAVYAAGVMSHYFTDPHMPFHTGQCEAEGPVHRPAEWSIACSYNELQSIIENDLGGYPEVELPKGADWLEVFVEEGALFSHPHYRVVIDHYNLAKGVKDPPAGLDQEIKDRIANCLGEAAVGVARILERAFTDAAVGPPQVELSLQTFLATLKVPIRWVTKKIADVNERAIIEKMYAEVQQTGKVVESLPEDDQQIRRQHAKEVLKTPLRELDALPPAPFGQKHGTGQTPRQQPRRPIFAATRMPQATRIPVRQPVRPSSPVIQPQIASGTQRIVHQPIVNPPIAKPQPVDGPREEKAATVSLKQEKELRFYLQLESPIADAPSIGEKTARRFQAIKVRTVAELLALDPPTASARLAVGWIDATVLRNMQSQAALVCRVPQLRGHDAQILVACGVTDPDALARMDARTLLAQLEPFLATTAGERIVRSSPKPDLEEVTDWINWAKSSRPLKAA